MNGVVQISNDLWQELRGFVNSVASTCDTCYHRRDIYCTDCETVVRAKRLKARLDVSAQAISERRLQDDPVRMREMEICNQLDHAKKSIPSEKIELPGCTRQNKLVILKKLVKRNIISLFKTSNGRNLYFLTAHQAERFHKQQH